MKILLATMLLHFQLAHANSCLEFYAPISDVGAANIVVRFTSYIQSLMSPDFRNACQAGLATCTATISKKTQSAADLAEIQGRAAAKLAKRVANPLNLPDHLKAAIRFSITPGGLKEFVLEPITGVLKNAKDAARDLELVQKGLINIQSLNPQPPGWIKGFTHREKTDHQILAELNKAIEDADVDLWAQSYYSLAIVGLIGVPKIAATLAAEAAGRGGKGSITDSAKSIAKAVIIDRFNRSFIQHKDLPMMERLRKSIGDAMNFEHGDKEIMAVKQVVLAEFGFDLLLNEMDRDPHQEVLQIEREKENVVAEPTSKPSGNTRWRNWFGR